MIRKLFYYSEKYEHLRSFVEFHADHTYMWNCQGEAWLQKLAAASKLSHYGSMQALFISLGRLPPAENA